MSQETIATLWRAQVAYNEGDWDAALATMDPSVVFDLTRVAPDGEIYEGYEGVKAFWRMLRDVFGDFRIDPEEVIDGGDRLFALMHLHGSGMASGAVGEDFLYQVVTLRQGRAARVDFFRDRDEPSKQRGWRSRRCRRRTWRSSRGGLMRTTDATLKRCALSTILTWNWTGRIARGTGRRVPRDRRSSARLHGRL